jgi:hypothetical protein
VLCLGVVLLSCPPLRSSFDDMLEHTSIAPWYGRMQAAVGESSCHHRMFTKGTSFAPGPHAPPPGTEAASSRA